MVQHSDHRAVDPCRRARKGQAAPAWGRRLRRQAVRNFGAAGTERRGAAPASARHQSGSGGEGRSALDRSGFKGGDARRQARAIDAQGIYAPPRARHACRPRRNAPAVDTGNLGRPRRQHSVSSHPGAEVAPQGRGRSDPAVIDRQRVRAWATVSIGERREIANSREISIGLAFAPRARSGAR